jgi:hypothetical protein
LKIHLFCKAFINWLAVTREKIFMGIKDFKGKAQLVCMMFLALGANAADMLAATLLDDALRVEISDRTGQVAGIAQGALGVLQSNADTYEFGDQTADENTDVAVKLTREKNELVVMCVNKSLGLQIEKRYLLRDGVLQKTARYSTAQSERALLRVASRSSLDENFRSHGYFYVATDDGYKVTTVPFTPIDNVKEAQPWLVSTGQFVFYAPRQNRIFAHYRHRINDLYFYGEAERDITSQFLTDGAITALGADFLDAQSSCTLVSHFAVLQGDARDYHQHRVSQPPYTDFHNSPVPSWFPRAKMYFPDGVLGTGRGLMENPQAVVEDVRSVLELLPADESLMVFFNHWSTTGDYPTSGNFRYLTYGPQGWSTPVPFEKLREHIRLLKAISPRVKVGGYFFFAPAEGTFPVREHPEWFVYNRDGKIVAGGDGVGWTGTPDFTTGYADYLQHQMRGALTTLGFDWVHFDSVPTEAVNWKTQRVVQSGAVARFYDSLHEFCDMHDKAIVQNFGGAIGWWADGAYVEVQQPDRWEKTDWRILAVPGYLSALYRSKRPHVWGNLVYGTSGTYGERNAQSGMRGWIRNASSWWRWIPQGLAYEDVIDELLEMSLSPANVSPSWWRMETDKLEVTALQRGPALILPMLWHDDNAGEINVSLELPSSQFKEGDVLFALDFRLMPSEPFSAFAPIPTGVEYSRLTNFRAVKITNAKYAQSAKLEPRRNAYRVLSPVPGWVYMADGKRPPFLLPQTRGMKLSGVLKSDAPNYELRAENFTKNVAEILAYVPASWRGASARMNEKIVAAQTLQVAGQNFLKVRVPPGAHQISVERVAPAASREYSQSQYEPPQIPAWQIAATRLHHSDLSLRAFEENGKSALELKPRKSGVGGNVQFLYVAPEKAGGFGVEVFGRNSGAMITVQQVAGAVWSYEIADDFSGWKKFEVFRENMKTPAGEPKWGPTTGLYFSVVSADDAPITIANVRLLPARPADIAEKIEVKKRLTISKTATSPVVDGREGDAVWQNAPVASEFYKMGGGVSPSVTRTRAVYDAENLYVLVESLEPIEDAGKAQARDAAIWNTNHIELFLQPQIGEARVLHLLADPAGTVQDFLWSGGGRDEKWNGDFEVKTGLNWKAGWVAEWKIPFAAIGRKPQAGEVWGFNIARKDIAGEWSNWATSGEWLDPDGFGEMEFVAGP